MDDRDRGDADGLAPDQADPTRPLSDAQLAMWLDQRADPATIAHNISTAVRIRTTADPTVLRPVLQRIVDVHAVLRTSFTDHDGEPRRVVHRDVPVDLEVHDAADWTDGSVARFVDDDHRIAFDLDRPPLCRFRVLDRGAGEYVLVITIHHLVGDLWTMALLGHAIADGYAAVADGGEPDAVAEPDDSYDRFVESERAYVDGPKGELAREHWRERYRTLQPLDIPGRRPRSDGFTGDGAIHTVTLAPESWAQLRERAAALGVPPRTFVLAAYQLLLGRLTGERQVHVLEIKANRNARQSRSFGCFVNPVLRTVGFEAAATADELLRAVHDDMTSSRAHERYPFGRIVRESMTGPRDGLFDAAFAWQKTTRAVDRDTVSALAVGDRGDFVSFGAVSVAPVEAGLRSAPSPLLLLGAVLDDRLELAFEYQTERFDAPTVEAFAQRLLVVLEQLIGDPDGDVDAIDVTLPAERETWRVEWDAAGNGVGGESALEMFERSLRRSPDAVAVRCGDEVASYAELDARVDGIAGLLRDAGVADGDLIGVCLERSIDMLATLLAVWRVGAAYVPIDPGFPGERVRAMLEDAQVESVVAREPAWRELMGSAPTCDTLVLDPADAPEGAPAGAGDSGAGDAGSDGSRIAYVTFTSGSTGRPKGVAVDHGNLANLLVSMAHEPGLAGDDAMLATTTLSFDISVLELMLPLSVGAEVVLVAHQDTLDPARLGTLLRSVTVAQGTPTLWRMLLVSGWAGSPELTILCGGEALPPDLAEQLLGRCRALWNMYGPTETTVWSAIHRVEPSDTTGGSVPIGRPIAGTRLHVLDERGRLVPDGVAGELWIAGAGVADGYVNRADLTDERFVPDPFVAGRMYRTGDLARRRADGALLCEGRVDDQVKVRGHRIELGEIEAVLGRHPDVSVGAATVHRLDDADVRLLAFVVPAHGDIDVDAVRTHLRRYLPDYMQPASITAIDAMPLTPNRKIDRQRLPLPTVEHHVLDERPATDPTTVEGVLSVCRRVFGDDGITAADDFFALGGHSLTATRICARLRAEIGRDVPVRAIYEHPVLGDFAASVSAYPQAPVDDGLGVVTDAVPGEPRPLSPSQRRMWFMQQLDPATAAYNLVGAIRVRGDVDVAAFELALTRLVEQHPGLRTCVVDVDGEPMAAVRDPAPIAIPLIELADGADDPLGAVRAAVRRLSRRPFDLGVAPLFRFARFRLADDDHVIGVVIHHLIADQWALGVLVTEVGRLYAEITAADEPDGEAITAVPGLEPHAVEHGSVLAERRVDDQLRFWRRQLDGVGAIELPTDRPRHDWSSDGGGSVTLEISDELRRKVDEVVVAQHVSEFMVYLAALQVLVHRITGDEDVPIGVPIANRHWLDSETLVTSLVNTVVMRTHLAGATGLGDALGRARRVALDAYDHQDLPFERLVDDLRPERHGRRSPLFQIFLNVQNAPFALPQIEGVALDVVPIEREAAQFELSFSIDPATTNTITVEYATDLFDEDRVRAWLHEFVAIASSFVDPSTPVSTHLPGASAAVEPPVREHAVAGPAGGVASDLERELTDIWETVLGTAPIDRHDDFFALGGHSLLAVRLFGELQQRTGRRVPLATLFEAPTIARLADVIERGGWLRPWTSMVEVVPGDQGPPLFVVAPYLISALSFHDLGEQLGSGHPLYVFQPQGFDDDAPVHDSVEAMAAHYIAEMQTVQPVGPYTIAGHCAGGWVAFEMARQLRESGHEVARLFVVDVEPPGIERPKVRWGRYVLSRVALYAGSGRLVDALGWQMRLALARVFGGRVGAAERRRLDRLRGAHAAAHAAYRGGEFDGDLQLVRSDEWARLADKDWHLAWSDLISGTMEVAIVRGAHSGLLNGDSVADLAASILAGSAPSAPGS
ncbi:MAG: amino acid adenylation domain-containing protein [Ilumatobacter sp.]|uniref:non-ribosomal peptide synthetase n=1 Tax=Ilumatobacter sp. TaxID=1967498 RepID=UPI00261202A7|nr:non-ribosomal peptide synthetase [Ilumatobacter sp.]MDJ0770842.1 amino acid adenylation domain-containing protein [Ilumatobacter sp.]